MPINHVRDINANTNVMQATALITRVMTTIATRLKEAREALGLSQEVLAKRAGVSQGTVANIEAGTRKNPRQLLEIAAAAGVNPDWLKNGIGPRSPSAAGASSAAPASGGRTALGAGELVDQLGQALAAVSIEDRARAVDLCTTLAKAPDSRSVRRDLTVLLASAGDRTQMWTWRDAAATMADLWPAEHERPSMQRFVAAVDAYLAEAMEVSVPPSVQSNVK